MPFLLVYRLLLALLIHCFSTAADTSVYTVLTITPTNQDQVDYLKGERLKNGMLDFWKEPTRLGLPVHVMIKDADILSFLDQLSLRNMTHGILINDVEQLIKKLTNGPNRNGANIYSHSTKNVVKFDFGHFHSYEEMVDYMEALASKFPHRVQVTSIGQTHQGRDIPVMKIGTSGKPNKPAIWIDGGIHAREWISPAVVLFMIDQLVGEYHNDPFIRKLVDNLDWYVTPMLNPDGYEFSRSSTDPEIRFWRKNMAPETCKTDEDGVDNCCGGVDLNRNFDWFFGEEGVSDDPCADNYNGKAPFSEPESAALRDFILSVDDDLKSFLTFHSYSQILMFPFGHTEHTYPQDVDDLHSIALRAARALKSVYGTSYMVGTGADILYPASGGSDDWAKGKMGVKYTFLFELRPKESNANGFLFDPSQIIPTALETWEAVKVIAEHVLDLSGSIKEIPKNQGPDVIGALHKIADSEKEAIRNPNVQIDQMTQEIVAEKNAIEMRQQGLTPGGQPIDRATAR